MSSCCAISSCVKPATSCSTRTARYPAGSRANAVVTSTRTAISSLGALTSARSPSSCSREARQSSRQQFTSIAASHVLSCDCQAKSRNRATARIQHSCKTSSASCVRSASRRNASAYSAGEWRAYSARNATSSRDLISASTSLRSAAFESSRGCPLSGVRNAFRIDSLLYNDHDVRERLTRIHNHCRRRIRRASKTQLLIR